LPNPKGLPSSLVQLCTAGTHGGARVTRPVAEVMTGPGSHVLANVLLNFSVRQTITGKSYEN